MERPAQLLRCVAITFLSGATASRRAAPCLGWSGAAIVVGTAADRLAGSRIEHALREVRRTGAIIVRITIAPLRLSKRPRRHRHQRAEDEHARQPLAERAPVHV